MRLSTQSRYGVRALFDIAYHAAGLSTQVKDIASRQQISPRYIEQIFQKLKKASLIKSVRGPAGGYYLAKKPEEIRVGDVIRATEKTFDLVHCVRLQPGVTKACARGADCVVKDIWATATAKLMEYFDSVTLEDLCRLARERGIERNIDKHLMYYI